MRLIRTRVWLLVVAFGALAAFAHQWRSSHQGAHHSPESSADESLSAQTLLATLPSDPLHLAVVRPSFIGMESCRQCHPQRVADFALTAHARTCREVVAEEMPPGFFPDVTATASRLQTRFPDIDFEMHRDGDTFYQTTVQDTPAGQRRVVSKIDLVYGAGGVADDVFLSWREDGTLVELPVVWLYQQQQWGASHFDVNAVGDLSRPLTVRCLECHNTWVHHVPGTRNQYIRSGHVLGVTCEVCHGPGEAHLAAHHRASRTGLDSAGVDQAIVNPAKLSRQQQIDLCIQCHSNATHSRRRAFSYRPGEPLEQYFHTLELGHNEDDHVANQISYLKQSKCFQDSEHMTCITCHDPHHDSRSQQTPSASCLTCHANDDCVDRSHQPEAIRDNCVQCHMPSYKKVNVNFQTHDDDFLPPVDRTEHRIGIYPQARKRALLEWLRTQGDVDGADTLSAELTSHYLDQADQMQAEHRVLAAIGAGREALAIDDSEPIRARLQELISIQQLHEDLWARALAQIASQQPTAAIHTLQEILRRRPTDAKAHGKLATQLATIGRRDEAIAHWKQVHHLDPNEFYGHSMLGWLALVEGRFEEALVHYQSADHIEPREAEINFRMGIALSRLGRSSEAVHRFRTVLEIAPQHLQACDQLILALRQSGNDSEALPVAQHAVHLTQGRQLGVIMVLIEILAATGALQEAITWGNYAVQHARQYEPGKLGEVEEVVAELKLRSRSLP